MSFLQPKVNIPPPPPPPPPPAPTPDRVVKAPSGETEKTKKKQKGKATMKTSQMTGPQGVTTEAPVEYKSLLGGK